MEACCSNCKKSFVLNSEQEELVIKLKSTGAKLAMLQCDLCGIGFGINPQTGIHEDSNEPVWNCPESDCNGYISFVDSDQEDSFYGCGECGTTWLSKEAF